jgi:IPT/TIG domain
MDGPADEPRRGTPSRRALGAMEHAVQRARAAGRSSPSQPTRPFERPAAVPPPHVGPRADPLYRPRDSERWLLVSVSVAATLVVIGAVALALSIGDRGQRGALPPSSSAAPSHGGTPAPGRPHGPAAGRRPSPAPTTTLPPASHAPPGGPPVIALLSPASGGAGDGIQVAGTNFLSSDGQIVASFNGQVAPTSCPAQNVCTVTVPSLAGSTAARVTITTAGGTSNAVTFTYS